MDAMILKLWRKNTKENGGKHLISSNNQHQAHVSFSGKHCKQIILIKGYPVHTCVMP